MSGTDSAGRFNILSQMEHLQSKYMGTGHADTTKFEWATHQHRWESNFRTRNQPRCHFSRDTFASLMGHTDLTNHLAICENETKARVRFYMLEKMLQPCGPPPEKVWGLRSLDNRNGIFCIVTLQWFQREVMRAPGGEGAKSGLTIMEVGAGSTVNFNNLPKLCLQMPS